MTGVVLKDQIADLDRIWMIALMLIVFGMALLVADRLPERRSLEEFRLRDALAMGQAGSRAAARRESIWGDLDGEPGLGVRTMSAAARSSS